MNEKKNVTARADLASPTTRAEFRAGVAEAKLGGAKLVEAANRLKNGGE